MSKPIRKLPPGAGPIISSFEKACDNYKRHKGTSKEAGLKERSAYLRSKEKLENYIINLHSRTKPE